MENNNEYIDKQLVLLQRVKEETRGPLIWAYCDGELSGEGELKE